jgi:hypothetical protein
VNRGRWSEYRASQVVPIGAGRETIQRGKLKKRKEKKRKERKKAGGERKSTACQCRLFNWDRVVEALKASRQGQA